MRTKKHITIWLTAAASLLAVSGSALHASAEGQNGWIQNGHKRYYIEEDGSQAVGTVYIDDIPYIFAPNGVQQTGWQTVDGKRYYYDPGSGEAVFGKLQWRGEWYYVTKEDGKITDTVLTDNGIVSATQEGILQTGWLQMQEKWYHIEPDSTPSAGIKEIEGQTYQFRQDGQLMTGWQTDPDGIVRYLDADSKTYLKGWLHLPDGTYYADPDRGRLTGAQIIESKQYYFLENGLMATGFQETANGITRYYDPQSGEMVIGMKEIDGAVYAFASDGAMQTGFLTQNGQTYYFNSSGRMHKGFLTDKNGQYYFDENGIMQTGFQSINGSTYFFDASGIMQRGFLTQNGNQYYFGADGSMQKGWITVSDKVYYADGNGILANDWKRIEGIIYYFAPNGIRGQGVTVINGTTFLLNDLGIPQTGWYTAKDGSKYYGTFNASAATGWQEINGKRYYFDPTGIMAVGDRIIDGKRYHFRADGTYSNIRICLDAGHYGKYNHSPVNSAYWESDFTWKMHLYLKEELERYDIEVITTRPNQETDLALEDRGKTSEGCDLFLSIHSNAGPASADGPLACCAINGSADELGLMLANKVADVMQTRERGSIWKREGLRGDWYGVLRGATSVGTPAILLEHSYHTNLRSTNWLLVDANVRRMAAAEAQLLAEYFGAI
ncbi:MAG TPA: hypothetical protein DCG49_03315 [Ruminococcus sp.]|nr:hypothetical protein [Ruminococcus sp.]